MENNAQQFNRNNFYRKTFCFFKTVENFEIDLKNFKYHSKSGSSYFFTDEGVYRYSNHWGRVGNCRWRLIKNSAFEFKSQQIGFARWKDFYENDDDKFLFFIDVNDDGTFEVNHRNHQKYNQNLAVFNAPEVKKRLQTIAMIQEDSNWTKHLNFENSVENQQKAIYFLRTTRKSWLAIKRILNEK